ncbi:hypothetical protein SK128_005203, partial [Halocaridina rubra]
VTICEDVFLDYMDANYTQSDFDDYCEIYSPLDCNFTLETTRAFFISITLPSRRKHIEYPPEVYYGRPLFNITYDLRPNNMSRSILNPPTQNFLHFCNLNGIATLHERSDG